MDEYNEKKGNCLYREPFESAGCFTGICPLAPILSQILTLAGYFADFYARGYNHPEKLPVEKDRFAGRRRADL